MKKVIAALAILMALVSILVIPSIAAADTGSGNTVVDGSVASTISVTPPSTVSLGALTPNQTIVSQDKVVSVTSNLASWTLTAVESGTTVDGCMAKTTSPFTVLPTPLKIKGGDQLAYASLATAVTLKANGSLNGSLTDVSFQQAVPALPSPGIYNITVVFTVSGSP